MQQGASAIAATLVPTNPRSALVLQPGFMLPGPLVPVASSRALLVSPAPIGPAQDGGGVWGSVPHETPEQAPHLGHGQRQQLGGGVVLVRSPRGRACAARRDKIGRASCR